jgi:hypothetical protein
MTRPSFARVFWIGAALVLIGCGGHGGGGHGGTGGTGGAGGATGSAGRGGSGGATGSGGSSSGGSGTTGTAGSGSSGTTGSGGVSGSSGTTGTGGASGSSGTTGTGGASGSSGTTGSAGRGGSGGTTGTGGASGSSGTTGTGGASGSGGTTGIGGASGTGGGIAGSLFVNTPSFSVAAAAETTQCMVLDLGNNAPVHVGGIKATFGSAVYEVRIGAAIGTAQPTPSPCTPFADIDSAAVRPLVLARSAADELLFPTGVGYALDAHQLLRFEVHAVNAGAAAANVSVSATLTIVPDATFQHEAGLLMLDGVGSSSIGEQATLTVGPVVFPVGSMSIFRVMGYTHKLGTGVKMQALINDGDPSPTTIYEPAWDPANPPVVTRTPPVALPAAGEISLRCSFTNNTPSIVPLGTSFGGSVNNERCAGTVSYFPAVPMHRCVHTNAGGGATLCCPGSDGCP